MIYLHFTDEETEAHVDELSQCHTASKEENMDFSPISPSSKLLTN